MDQQQGPRQCMVCPDADLSRDYEERIGKNFTTPDQGCFVE